MNKNHLLYISISVFVLIVLGMGCSPSSLITITESSLSPSIIKTLTITPFTDVPNSNWIGETENKWKIIFQVNEKKIVFFRIPIIFSNCSSTVNVVKGEGDYIPAVIEQGRFSTKIETLIMPEGGGILDAYPITVAINGSFINSVNAQGTLEITDNGKCKIGNTQIPWQANNENIDVQDLIATADFVPTNTPVKGPDIQMMAIGDEHTCALLVNGNIMCWGSNFWGELGNGTQNHSSFPVEVKGLAGKAVSVAAGRVFTCALLDNGNVQCWGNNNSGAIGIGHTQGNVAIFSPTDVLEIDHNAIALSAAGDNACALLTTGIVKCWGSNSYGVLGADLIDGSIPVEVKGVGKGGIDIVSGGHHNCVLFEQGYVKCWGEYSSILTYGVTIPTQLPGINKITSLAAGMEFTCGLTTDGEVKCYGETKINSAGLKKDVAQVAASQGAICALMKTNNVKCWGDNLYNVLGISLYDLRESLTPVDIPTLESGIRYIAGGYNHYCAIANDNVVKCWGSNGFGQLGDGTFKDSFIPVSVIW
jgi:alpha-tubulin suppressor-like RCC1 family protein